MFKNRSFSFFVLLIVIAFGSGYWFSGRRYYSLTDVQQREEISKLIHVTKLIDNYYVEEPQWNKLVSGAISGMLKELDPHTLYIPKKII